MGRTGNYPNHGPRTSLVANREIRQAMRGTAPPAFGIRRMLDRESDDRITDVTFGLYATDDIPEKVRLRDRLSVTLLSQKVIGRQLARGVIAGYNLGRTSAMVERSEGCSERLESLEIGLGDVRIFAGRVVYVAVLSHELEEEIDAIHGILGSIGIRGIAKKEKPFVPHMTLGEVEQGKALSRVEQKHVIERLSEDLPGIAQVDPWDVYPDDVFDTSRR
jgi:hypothetical protein